MRRLSSIFLNIGVILLSGLLFSCGGTHGDEDRKTSPQLSVAPSSVTIPASGGSVNVTLSSNVSWSSSNSNSTFTVSPASGSTSTTVQISAPENTSNQQRSAVVTFTPKGGSAVTLNVTQSAAVATKYADGEYKLYQKSTKSKPITLVFTGDGYTQDMFTYESGKFDKDINEAISYLFDIEPYKTYKEYFTIYKLALYSKEAGVSIKRPTRKIKDTRFKCMWENVTTSSSKSTLIECNMDSVKKYWATIPGLQTDEAQTFAPFCIIINDNIKAGTVNALPSDLTMTPRFGGLDFKTVSMIPLGNEDQSFKSLIQHEIGGHGIGMLADEYAFSTMGAIPTEIRDKLIQMQNYGPLGFGWNLAYDSDPATAPWAQFLSIQKYIDQGIGMYEGGMNFGMGAWRSSYDSCMKNNKPYFNVQSRWLIYKRIKYTAGESYSLEDFMANDKETQFELPPSSTAVNAFNGVLKHPVGETITDCVVFK